MSLLLRIRLAFTRIALAVAENDRHMMDEDHAYRAARADERLDALLAREQALATRLRTASYRRVVA